MATITLSNAAANNVLTAINDLFNGGAGAATIKIYNGTKPAGPDTAVSSQTLLATLTASDPAGSVATRALTFGSVTQDSAADATGTASWARIADSDGVAVADIDVSSTGGSGFLQLNTTSIVIGGPVLISSFIITA